MAIFATLPLVSAVVPAQRERVKVLGLLRGRLVRSGGKPVAAEIDVVDPATGFWTGRTTLVPVADVEPVNLQAQLQMDDLGHLPDCACSTCTERRK